MSPEQDPVQDPFEMKASRFVDEVLRRGGPSRKLPEHGELMLGHVSGSFIWETYTGYAERFVDEGQGKQAGIMARDKIVDELAASLRNQGQ